MKHSILPIRVSVLILVVLIYASVLFSACGAVSLSGCINTTPVPKLDSVSPTAIDTRSLPMMIVLTGSDFQTWSTIQLNAVTIPTNYVDSRHLSVILTTEILGGIKIVGGTGALAVFTFDPNGCGRGDTSSTVTIVISG